MSAVQRKKQARFSQTEDLKLLREVLAKNPYDDKNKWAEIATGISTQNFQIDGRRARERTQLLLTQFQRETSQNLKKSGIDEEYDEKDQLLEEIQGLIEETERQKQSERQKVEKAEKASLDIRKRAMESLASPKKDDDGEQPKIKQSKSSNNILSFLKEKKDAELEAKREELELKKSQLELEREKFELEKEERKQKMEMERKEKLMIFDLFKKLSERN